MNKYIICMVSPHDNKFIVKAKSINEAKQQIPVKWRASYVIAKHKDEQVADFHIWLGGVIMRGWFCYFLYLMLTMQPTTNNQESGILLRQMVVSMTKGKM